jgi:hypothetical protein
VLVLSKNPDTSDVTAPHASADNLSVRVSNGFNANSVADCTSDGITNTVQLANIVTNSRHTYDNVAHARRRTHDVQLVSGVPSMRARRAQAMAQSDA